MDQASWLAGPVLKLRWCLGARRMADSTKHQNATTWLWWFPPASCLAEYCAAWLPGDIIAILVSLAYAGLAGLPPQVGVYGYLLGGLGYALLGSSRPQDCSEEKQNRDYQEWSPQRCWGPKFRQALS
jgi:Sulfate permease family